MSSWRSKVSEFGGAMSARYCTSLEMAGLSVTLCKVDDKLKSLLLAPAEVLIRVF